MEFISIFLFVLGGFIMIGVFNPKFRVNNANTENGEDALSKNKGNAIVIALILIVIGYFVWPGEDKKDNVSTSEGAFASQGMSHKDSIQQLFNGYDGSNTEFVKAIKEDMNDADSFEHVSTTYIDMGDHIMLNMKYRGKNAFGAKVINYARGRQDIVTGQITDIKTDY